jgi:hypothetical protein
MFNLLVFMLATLPSQVFIFWGLGWWVVDTVRERRIARAAAAEARAAYALSAPERPRHEPTARILNATSANPRQNGMDRSANFVSGRLGGTPGGWPGGMDVHG